MESGSYSGVTPEAQYHLYHLSMVQIIIGPLVRMVLGMVQFLVEQCYFADASYAIY